MRRVKEDFSKCWRSILGIVIPLFPVFVFGQSGPIDYTQASNNLAQFFILSSSHQAVRPTNDFGRFWGTYTQSSNWEESYSSEYGLSMQVIPINQLLRDSLTVFNVDNSQIPKNIYVPRFHYMLGLKKNLAVGLNLLYYPDWQMYGVGVTGEYTFLNFDHFYTGFLANYGGAWINNFMAISSGAISLIETYAQKGFEVYGGIKYIAGKAAFDAPSNQAQFDSISYQNELGTSYLIGLSLTLKDFLGTWDESLTLTSQVDFEKNLDPNYIFKLTLKVPSHRSYSQPLGKTRL